MPNFQGRKALLEKKKKLGKTTENRKRESSVKLHDTAFHVSNLLINIIKNLPKARKDK